VRLWENKTKQQSAGMYNPRRRPLDTDSFIRDLLNNKYWGSWSGSRRQCRSALL